MNKKVPTVIAYCKECGQQIMKLIYQEDICEPCKKKIQKALKTKWEKESEGKYGTS